MNIKDVLLTEVKSHLPYRFEKGQALYVAHRAPYLHYGHVHSVGHRHNLGLYLVRNMGYYLDGLAEIIPPSLLGYDGVVDLACGEVVLSREFGVGETLVVAEVEVRLRPVVCDKDLAVLKGAHGAGVHIYIRVELLYGYGKAARLEERAHGGAGKTLAER